jgi:GTP cyclohydrolase IA
MTHSPILDTAGQTPALPTPGSANGSRPAAQPQTQERLTMQIAKCLDENLRPRGAGVVLEAEHTCMTQRGIRALGATTVTSALLGTLRTDPRSRAEFFTLARVPTSPVP